MRIHTHTHTHTHTYTHRLSEQSEDGNYDACDVKKYMQKYQKMYQWDGELHCFVHMYIESWKYFGKSWHCAVGESISLTK